MSETFEWILGALGAVVLAVWGVLKREVIVGFFGGKRKLPIGAFFKFIGRGISRAADGDFSAADIRAQTADGLNLFPKIKEDAEARKKLAAALRAVADGVEGERPKPPGPPDPPPVKGRMVG